MELSAPIYRLKRDAKRLARDANIPHHAALARIAAREGFTSWSLLVARAAEHGPAGRVFAELAPGDLVLIGARPGQGKTLLGLELALEALKAGHRAAVFTLEETQAAIRARLGGLGADPARLAGLMIDDADTIDAGHIVAALAEAAPGTLAFVDYLQLLDQRRTAPDLATQLAMLKAFAAERRVTVAITAQIHRAYDPAAARLPGLGDVRLPNPLDLAVFDKACFLNDGRIRLESLH